jgi:hypothetical protein
MAWGNKSSSENENDDDLPYLNELVKANVEYAKLCTSQQNKNKRSKRKKLIAHKKTINFCLNNMKLFQILMLSYLIKLSNMKLVQTHLWIYQWATNKEKWQVKSKVS